MSRRKERYHYTGCGLDNIFLVNGFRYVESPRGKSVQIQNLEGLHRAIGEMLVGERKHLDRKEFRFLRHELNMTQQNLSALLGVDVQSVARWEKSKTEAVPGPAQRIIRLLYQEKVNGNPEICEPLERLAELDELISHEDEIDFTDTQNGWQPASAIAA